MASDPVTTEFSRKVLAPRLLANICPGNQELDHIETSHVSTFIVDPKDSVLLGHLDFCSLLRLFPRNSAAFTLPALEDIVIRELVCLVYCGNWSSQQQQQQRQLE